MNKDYYGYKTIRKKSSNSDAKSILEALRRGTLPSSKGFGKTLDKAGGTQLIACCEANLELKQQVKPNYISENQIIGP